MKRIVIYCGGFHPFTPAHLKTYEYIEKMFDDVLIATTDKTENRPFTFKEKKILMIESGVPENRIIQIEQPYSVKEIVSLYDEPVYCVFIVSKKDQERLSDFKEYKPGISKKEKYYVYYTPIFSFYINNKKIFDASEIRELYKKLQSKEEKINFLKQLYPKSKNINKIFDIFNRALGRKNYKEFINEMKGEDYLDWGIITDRGINISGHEHKKARFHGELVYYLIKEKSSHIPSEFLKFLYKEYIENDYDYDWVSMKTIEELGWIRWYLHKKNIVVIDIGPRKLSDLSSRQKDAVQDVAYKYKDKHFQIFLEKRDFSLSYSELLNILE